ncbi:MAG: hypothetical protein ACFFC7_20085 [Candidatus Hermodarchaeota archaeon]
MIQVIVKTRRTYLLVPLWTVTDDKLAMIFKNQDIQSITLVNMQVGCCFGTRHIVQIALEKHRNKRIRCIASRRNSLIQVRLIFV